jgi:hypothetical protein
MSAIDHVEEANKGIKSAANSNDDVAGRCASGGKAAASSTTSGKPVIKEWEFGDGAFIVFTCIDSCLGAVQVAGQNSVRGAHFSMYASGQAYDSVQFDKAMTSAGFDKGSPIYYFGGGVPDWKKGLVNSVWWKQATALPFKDAAQKAWIFEQKDGKLTVHAI